MERDELRELHYIAPIESVPSMLRAGILCHDRAPAGCRDLSDPSVQAIRATKRVTGTDRTLHSYANLYLNGRNAMLYKRCGEIRDEICVLRISTDVLHHDDVVITDFNAATGLAAFAPSPEGLQIVRQKLTFAQYWTHADYAEARRRRAACQAEVLVPDRIDPQHIDGAYVASSTAESRLNAVAPGLPVTINRYMFFLP